MDQSEIDQRVDSIQAGKGKASQRASLVAAISIAVIVAFLWRSCGSAGDVAAPKAAALAEQDAAWAAEMQLRVKATLKDPSSAQFRNVRTYHGSGAPVVCGEVNSKNGFGGYGGFQRFVASGPVIAVEEQMPAGEMNKTWPQLCK